MKKHKLLNSLLLAFGLSVVMISCDNDEDNVPSSPPGDFATLASSYYEADGTGTVTIPFRDASAKFLANAAVTFTGTATEGEDFNLVGVTQEGVQISIIDDEELEPLETIRVVGNFSGNSVHEITIVSNCQDKGGLEAASFAGVWDALEDYGSFGTFGPYSVTLVQDATNLNKFTFTNFYGSGATYIAYVILDIPTGTVKFPDQTVGAPTYNRGPITLSSGTFDLCQDHKEMHISLFYDGLQWDYHFTQH
jgi:hypothetical protein